MKYITLQEFVHSGLPRETIVHVYNMYGELVQIEKAINVDEYVSKCEIYDIEILGLNDIKIRIDSSIDAAEVNDEDED